MSENILNSQQIADLKICGQILKEAIYEAKKACLIGVSTAEIDQVAENALLHHGAKPSFKGYEVSGIGRYPSALCISINDEIVHGLPDKHRLLQNGDVVSLDLGAEYKGIFTDMAITFGVGQFSEEISKLLEVTAECLKLGIATIKPMAKIGDIGAAVESNALKHHFGVIRDYVGHGIGEKPHLSPQIPNFGREGTGPDILEHMALAIEPMITLGGSETQIDDNHWTVKTADKSIAAHFEHTVIVENGFPVIVTQ